MGDKYDPSDKIAFFGMCVVAAAVISYGIFAIQVMIMLGTAPAPAPETMTTVGETTVVQTTD